MRACFVFLCILTATFAVSVKTKPHGKHHGLHKTSHIAKEKDIITEESNKPQILPTLVPFEDSSLEQEDEELTSESNANANKEEGGFEVHERSGKSTAVLLSDEELADILKKEAEEEHEMEEALEEAEVETGKGKVHSGEIARDGEMPEMEEDEKEGAEEDERVMEETAEDAEMLDNEELEVEMMPLLKKGAKSDEKIANRREQGALFEETDGSTDSEIPADLDYAADSGILQPLRSVSTTNHLATDTQGLPQTEDREQETGDKGQPTTADDFEQDLQNTETVDYGKETSAHKQVHESNADIQELQENTELKLGSKVAGKEEEKGKNDSESHSKGKVRKHKKNQRARKHFPQNEEPQSGQEQSLQESESGNTDNTATKAKRRRAGKWGPLVGLNPVQIRATVDLYPSSRSALAGDVHHPEVPADPCAHFPCKRGKMCKLDADDKPVCVCQEPSECPPSVNEFDQVCGTDNKTYDTSCELFATKCKQEGSKRGHRLHLDYTGPCKLIPPCMENELVQFPLRMRDWLKNVLLQLYEHDSMSPGFLTPKQRFRVKKIFESERRLHAGNHSVELLAQDFEKNYNMYIYPVHWQFAQLDQHPSDRFLSHSELAPLRVPLVPMEHCTSRFFQECDADKDKQVSFKEWTSCFGIKNEDMDVNQLF